MTCILIIEEEPYLQKLYKDSLSEEGYQVAVAQNGFEGYKLYQHLKPNMVIYDVFRPTMEIYQTISKIRKENPNLPILMITEHLNDDNDLILQLINHSIFKTGDLTEMKTLIDLYLNYPSPTIRTG